MMCIITYVWNEWVMNIGEQVYGDDFTDYVFVIDAYIL